MSATPQQIEVYFLQRLDPYRIRHSRGNEYRSRCPFHGGSNVTALAVNLEDGLYFCHACGAKGKGIGEFEMHLQKAESGSMPPIADALRAAEQVVGTPFERRVHQEPVIGKRSGWNRKQARDRYIYTDETGNEMFSVWRFVDAAGNKVTPPDHPCGCSPDSECQECEGGRVWGSKGVRRVLYRLPDVLQSLVVFVVEGEKNCNDLSRALGTYLAKARGLAVGALTVDRVGVTCNPGGAKAWKPEYGYGRYFQGKIVIKLGDNDESGRQHDEDVCRDVAPFASQVFRLALPVGEGEDISDFLQEHTVEDLLQLLPNRVAWQQPAPQHALVKDNLVPRALLVKPSELVRNESEGGDWLVDRLIPRNSRGLVIAPPKTGKSFFFLDLAIALATCGRVLSLPSLGRPVRTAIISREDGPQLVSERLRGLARGRNLDWSDVDRNIRINTVQQSQTFRIDNDEDLTEMAEWLRGEGIEFTVLDVLNKLHGGEENSANDMTKVMARFDELARLSGSQVCVIHHTNKGGGARGSSSIAGWADTIFRLESDESDERLKRLFVQTKFGSTPTPRLMRYVEDTAARSSRIEMVVQR
ncbi:AAA family ATPase [Terriglobus aquaticus]|uniref:AAA family ATPase n=1 Tax=Terriglobus aquaticus TaxID=940139 RepID=A0ABW9KH04_9BACT|nr:AAA family ATPase [Terriglobus aquaticus]